MPLSKSEYRQSAEQACHADVIALSLLEGQLVAILKQAKGCEQLLRYAISFGLIACAFRQMRAFIFSFTSKEGPERI
jgi:hypothetical protein